MIDTHAHLDFPEFDEDREEVIRRAFDNGVKNIVNVGVDLETSQKSIDLAERHEDIFAAVGIHPEFFSKRGWGDQGGWKNIFEGLKNLAKHEKVVAIGEAGLDYFRIGESGEIGEIKERQKKGFLAQIEIAGELRLPVVVHCREAWGDVFDIVAQNSKRPPASICEAFRAGKTQNHNAKLKTKSIKFVLHCYSGNTQDAEEFLKMPNVYFSFSGNITYPKPVERKNNFEEVIKIIPLDRIMLDSDSPFLAPQAVRGRRNEPAHIRYIAKKIAEIKKISVNEIEKTTDDNAENFFGIG